MKLPWAVRFRRLLPRELASWVEHRVTAQGCRIVPAAVSGLIEAIGNDLRALASEIEKLVSFVGVGQTIDAGSLAVATADVRETSAFELARLVTARDLDGALRAWEKFSASGEYPGLALGALIHQVRQLWRFKLARLAGVSPERIGRELNIPPFMVQRLAAQATELETARLRQWFEALFEADQQLKGSGLPPQAVFERVILRLCLGKSMPHVAR
jgi:DNA polymerase-3 subunit delta